MQVPMPRTDPTQSTQSNRYFRFMNDLVLEQSAGAGRLSESIQQNLPVAVSSSPEDRTA
jgi:hypothetical protein